MSLEYFNKEWNGGDGGRLTAARLSRKRRFPMIAQQFLVNGLAHISYILEGSETCTVIDPCRDIQIFLETAPLVFAVDPKDEKLIGQKHIMGRFGIVNPAIVGGTIYLGNSWDWVIAVPVSEVNPNYRP
jgi:hypothetical protein